MVDDLRKGNYMKNDMKKMILVKALGSAVIVFISGFVMMNFLWILIGTGIAFIGLNHKYVRMKRHICCMMISILSVICATTIQIQWIVSDYTKLNWTIPQTHHFNVAGWYHAVFFIFMFGVYAYLITNILSIIKIKAEDYSWIEKNLLLFFIMAQTLFLLLWISDDYFDLIKNGKAYLFVCCLELILSSILIYIINKKRLRDLLFSVSLGCMSAMGICLSMTNTGNGNAMIAIGGTLCTCFLYCFSVQETLFISLYMMLTSYGIFYELSKTDQFLKSAYIYLALIIILLFYAKNIVQNRNNKIIDIGAIGFSIVAYSYLNGIADIWQVIICGVMSRIFNSEIQTAFKVVLDSEGKMNAGQITEKELRLNKGISYAQIIAGVLAIGIFLLQGLKKIAHIYERDLTMGNVSFDETYLGGGILILALMGIIILVNNQLNNGKRKICREIMIAMMVWGYCILGRKNVLILIQTQNDPIMLGAIIVSVLSVFANIGAAVMVAYGYYKNIIIIRGLKKKIDVQIMSCVIGIGCFIVSFSSSLAVSRKITVGNILLFVVNIILAFVILPVLSGIVMQMEYEKSSIVLNKPLEGIALDGFLGSVLILGAAYIPCFLGGMISYSGLSFNFTENIGMHIYNLAIWGVTVGVIFSTAFEPVLFCTKNNLVFLTKQYQKIETQSDRLLWEKLHTCLVAQSKQTIFAMIPYVIIVLCKKWWDLDNKDIKLSEWKKDLIHEYIDKDSYDGT